MTALDRPTLEQMEDVVVSALDEALNWLELVEVRGPADAEFVGDARRAIRCAASVARTPQPAEPDVIRSVGTLRRAGGNVDRWDGRRWVPTVIVAGSTRQGPWAEDAAPPPAVPNGEAARPCSCCDGDPLTVCAACEQHSCWAGRFMCEFSRTAGTKQADPAGDGEDVPARLDAARSSLLRHYLAKTAARLDLPDQARRVTPTADVDEIESVGEAVLAELERLRTPDGIDVLVRLDAAAEALDSLGWPGTAHAFRDVASQLRGRGDDAPDARAVVAAALAGDAR